MTQRVILFVVVMIIFCCDIGAQSKVSGVVIDKENKVLASANVLLLRSADSLMIKGIVTSSNGEYAFENIKAGSYLVTASLPACGRFVQNHLPSPQAEKTLNSASCK